MLELVAYFLTASQMVKRSEKKIVGKILESIIFILLFFKKIYYLFIHDRHGGGGGRDTGRRRSRLHREPDMGLDPRSPGSRPGLQAALNRCAIEAARKYHF